MVQIDFVVDARCYQDPNYAFRGIGYSTMSLLRHCPEKVRSGHRFIAAASPRFSPLPNVLADAFDVVTMGPPPKPAQRSIFFQPSPLTHDARAMRTLLRNPAIFSVAFIHDFIPYDFPDIQEVSDFMTYCQAMEALREYDLYVVNSAYTARRAREILGIGNDRLFISRIGARAAFFEKDAPSAEEQVQVEAQLGAADGFFLSVAGDAERKNIECAIEAVRLLNRRTGRRHRLAVVGSYSPRNRARLAAAGCADVVLFLGGLSDEMLGHLYRTCITSIVPSRIEGFSMPIVEAIAAGGPVVASTCDAHLELVLQPEALFAPDSPEELSQRLEALLINPGLRSSLIERQAGTVAELKEPEVGRRFWEQLTMHAAAARPKAPGITRHAKPSFAFVTPFLPHQSGVAIAMTNVARELAQMAHVDIYTHAEADIRDHSHLRSLQNLEEAKRLGHHDMTLYVLGNCRFHHGTIYDLTRTHRQGDHVLLADSIMVNMHYDRLGPDAVTNYAADILKRPVSLNDYHGWLSKPQSCPMLGFEEFFGDGWHLIVHSQVMKKEMERRGAPAVDWIPHATNVPFQPRHFDPELRSWLRRDFDYGDDEMIVATMGSVSDVKGALECVMAIRELVDWGCNARLIFAGGASVEMRNRIVAFARHFRVDDRVLVFSDYITVDFYRNQLIAADVAVQLRKVPFGQTSGGLADCIGAGITTVANDTMARAIDAPEFVLTVPDLLSPVLIAEKLLEAREVQRMRPRDSEDRRAYCDSHSFARFADGLMALVS